ncbi:MAG: helix-turn-helix domain-containing protein, partial [Phenylobacterium sp.]
VLKFRAVNLRREAHDFILGVGKLGRDPDELTRAVNGVIARRVRAQRGKLGMSLAELAQASGVALSTLNSLEERRAGCSAIELWKLSLALDVPIAELCAPSPDRSPLERLYSFMRGHPPGRACGTVMTVPSVILRSPRRIH